MSDPVTEVDLLAFVDDQLPAERRLDVEGHLARHPEIAARVMADLRARDALKLAFDGAPIPHPSERVFNAARSLAGGLLWRRVGHTIRRAAAVIVLVGAGWIAHAQTGLLEITDTEASPKQPAFVEEARHAHQTALIRARMMSQHEVSDYNPQEILRETGIALPSLPRDWRVVDAQVFPARSGPSVELAVDAGPLGRVSLFAGRAASFGVIRPTTTRSSSGVTAYWQTGELFYALTGSAPETTIERAATTLESSFR